MEIRYKNSKLKKVCTDAIVAKKTYGLEMAIKIAMRIEEISLSESVEEMIKFRLGRCHELKGSRKKQYAVDLVHPYRMVFEKSYEMVDSQKKEVLIIEIVDYH